ncbi:MAG: Rpn family recombination-promoting nuclease/putative transposase [Bacteroidales bacterium]|nr:Rpn family recombination-promoting nuclease/putative transposase [Bacteroidales bacterium]
MKKYKDIFQIPTTDFTFKRIFANESNKQFLKDFLNTFLAQDIGEIVDVVLLPTEKYGGDPSQRRVVYDAFCKDITGRHFLVEMQCAQQLNYIDRSIIYTSRAISDATRRGDHAFNLVPTYSINILDCNLPIAQGRSFVKCYLKDQDNKILTNKMGIYYIFLRNFAAEQPDVTKRMRMWMYILWGMGNMDEADYQKLPSFFRGLLDTCRIKTLNTMAKEEYKKSVLEYEDVRIAVEDNHKIGFAEGVKEGLKEGMEKGREEGRQRLWTAAKNLLKMGVPLETVSQAIGLSIEELQQLES